MKRGSAASAHAGEPLRYWHVGRCACGSARAAVEVGDGDDYSRRELSEFFGYVVEREPGPVRFQAHAETCQQKEKR